MKSLFLFLFGLITLFGSGVDIIVCSFNRPMQLYALLESIDKRVTGASNIYVICRSDPQFTSSYEVVEKDFPNVEFVYQPNNEIKAHGSFKPIVIDLLFNQERSDSDHFLFAMDDIIVVRDIDLDSGRNLLERNPNIYAFLYRLGKNIKRQDYTAVGYSGVPPLTEIEENVFSWDFSMGKIDWNYPNNLDFTLYRKAQVRDRILSLNFINPNHFEGAWAKYAQRKGLGACHCWSKIVNIPMNRVNTTHPNAEIGNYSTADLNEFFIAGKKIDIESIDPSLIESVHQDMQFNFINRE